VAQRIQSSYAAAVCVFTIAFIGTMGTILYLAAPRTVDRTERVYLPCSTTTTTTLDKNDYWVVKDGFPVHSTREALLSLGFPPEEIRKTNS